MKGPRGVFCAAVSPLNDDLTPDLDRFAAHVQSLLQDGCDGVALLGTTGEANSFSVSERKAMLEAAIGSGVDASRLMPGTGVAAYTETIELTKHAVAAGAGAVVMLPPFYYKDVTDDGLLDGYRAVFNGVGDNRLRVVLYHIPPISRVPLSIDLIGRLREEFPEIVVGVKDSSGDIENMKALTKAYPELSIFAGADPLMLPLLAEGGAGCITATSNIVSSDLATIYAQHADASRKADVAAAQERVVAMRNLVSRWPQIAAIKAALGVLSKDAGWDRMRPPLQRLASGPLSELAKAIGEAQLGGRFATV